MKLAKVLNFTAVCALVFSVCAGAYAQSDHPGYATAVRITGEARYSHDGTTWLPLVVGEVLSAGDVVETATDGSLDLVLGQIFKTHAGPNDDVVAPPADLTVRGMVAYQASIQQNVIHLESGTVLAIKTLTVGDTGVDAVSNTELDLRKGAIFGSVKKLSASSQYLIDMPNGIAGIRGTVFAISLTPPPGIVTVTEGSMVISYTGPNGVVTFTVTQGQQLNLGSAAPPVTLSPTAYAAALAEATQTITVMSPVANPTYDRTILYISPVTGYYPYPKPL
ncbi:MAG: FecR domain-containing protein [Limisphaerales bacterium]